MRPQGDLKTADNIVNVVHRRKTRISRVSGEIPSDLLEPKGNFI